MSNPNPENACTQAGASTSTRVESVPAWIQSVIDREFHTLRTKNQRSDPYIEGFRSGLVKRITGRCPPMVYQPGTAAADAFIAGKEEARDFEIAPALLAELQALHASNVQP